MALAFADFTTLTFDCYGTLIDWETGIWDAYQPLIAANRRNDITRQVALEAHAELESARQAAMPSALYPQILRYVHNQFARRFDLSSNDTLDAAFGDSPVHWPAFPDTADALRILKNSFRLVILSNIHRDGFAASSRKLGVEFDAIYTAEDIGSYKPDRRNFEYLLARLKQDLEIEPGDILHTAQSLFHDHAPATEFGLARAWIDRQSLKDSENWGATAKVETRPGVDFIFPTLGRMADAVTMQQP